jgi:GH24 family phage-related lysozyme (muramidase)
MKLVISEHQYEIIQSRLNYERVLEEMVFKINILTEDGKTEPDMEWDFTNVKDDIDVSKLWVKTKEDVKEYVQKLKEKIKNLPSDTKKRILKYALYSFLGILSMKQINNFIEPQVKNIDNIVTPVIKSDKEETHRIRQSSEKLFNHLKWEEGSVVNKGEPALTLYDLGDGAYTVGYGHAIFNGENEGYDFLPNYNKLRPGRTRITKENAETLLKDDIKVSEGIINGILDEWEQNGVKPKLTQGMYDAMVSMAYNMGPKIKNKKFIDAIKQGDYELARKLITQTSSSLFDDFPGLKTRREKEAKMFT